MIKIILRDKMKKLFIALFALLFLAAMPSVLAITNDISITNVEINGGNSEPLSVMAGDVLKIQVEYTAYAAVQDAVIEAELTYGHDKKVEDSSKAIDTVDGTHYIANLEFTIPANIEVTPPGQYYTLSIVAKGKSGEMLTTPEEIRVTVQKANDEISIQKVMTDYMEAGQITTVTVVAKNIGTDTQDDVYVVVSIPKLGIEKEERMGNIAEIDKGEGENVATVDVPLLIPENAVDGSYTMNVEVYNDNTDLNATKTVSINGVQGAEKFVEVISTSNSQEMAQGGTAVYTLRIANLGSSAETYSLSVEGTEGWATYQMNPLVLTLSPESSQMITVSITAADNALIGDHTFTVKAKSESAEKTIPLTASVGEKKVGFDAMLISVIVLAIVLVILIVLLVKTRKAGDEISETEESYY